MIKKVLSITLFSLFFAFLISSCSDSPTTIYDTEPLFVNTKKLDNGITVTYEISGAYMDKAKVIFNNGLKDIGYVFLDMNTPELYNVKIQEGAQYVYIYFISISPPTKYIPGTIIIECDYTDRNGNNLLVFNGLISAWTMP